MNMSKWKQSSPQIETIPKKEKKIGNLPINITQKHIGNLFTVYEPENVPKVHFRKKCYSFVTPTKSEDSPELKSLHNQIYEGQRHPKLLYLFMTLPKYFFKKMTKFF